MSRYAACRTVDNGAYLISAYCNVTNQFTTHLGVEKWGNTLSWRTTPFLFPTNSKCFLNFWISTKHSFLLILSCRNTMGHYFLRVSREAKEREREWNEGRKIRKREEKRCWPEKNSMTSCLTSNFGHSHQQRLARLKMAISQNPFWILFDVLGSQVQNVPKNTRLWSDSI